MDDLVEIGELTVLRRLGAGGFGAVYLAEDRRLHRKVAVKLAHEGRGDLWREARAAARLAHPNIVTIYEVGDLDGRPYVVMEYIDGPTLRERLAGPLDLEDALRIARDLVAAIAAAHRAGIVHLDLTPANVLLATDGRTRVVDFGLAREVGSTPESVGTPAYMAPEQWRGEVVGAAADVWAIGAILHALLVRLPPVDGSAAQVRERVVAASPLELTLDDQPAELAALVRSCLQKDPAARPTAQTVLDTLEAVPTQQRDVVPFRGLETFTEAAAASFHGRDDVIARVTGFLPSEHAIAIVGPSGVGKSSLVHAGVVSQLRRDGWLIASARPGRRPFAAIAAALHAIDARALIPTGEHRTAHDTLQRWLAKPELFAVDLADLADAVGRLVLVVDQLEELETLTDPAQRAAVAAALALAVEGDGMVRIIFTVRDDFLGRLAARMSGAIGHVIVLAPPGPAALEQILELPIVAAGYRIERDLLRTIAGDLAGEPGALALLQSVGVALWEHRDREQRSITMAAYEAIGGVAGAFANHAQRVLSSCTPEEVAVLRTLVLRLLTPSATRRPLPRDELLAGLPPRAAEVLERLIAARIVIARVDAGEHEVELVHEALATRWPALATWLDEGRGDRVALDELETAARRWDRIDRPATLLWTGEPLREAERVLARARDASEPAHVFVAASRRRDRRARWTRRIGVIAGLALLGAVIAIFAVQRGDARASAALATTRAAEANVQAAWGVLRNEQVLEARAYLRSAVETAPVASASELWWRLGFEPVEWTRDDTAQLEALTWAPDGSGVFAGRLEVRRYDLATAVPAFVGAHADSVMSAATGGGLAVTGGIDGAIRRWPAGDVFATHADPVLALAVSAAFVVAGDAGGRVSIWNHDGTEHARYVVPGGVADIAVTERGAVAAIDMRGRLHERTASGQIEIRDGLAAARVAVRGDEIVVGGSALAIRGDRVLRAVGNELHDGTRIVGRTRGTIRAVRISPDGARVAVLSGARTISVMRLDAPPVQNDRGFRGEVRDTAFTPDGKHVIAAGDDGTLRMFDVATGAMVRAVSTGHGRVRALVVDPAGSLLTGGDDGTARRWMLPNLDGGSVVATHADAVTALAVTAGKLATGSADRTVTVWGSTVTKFDAGAPVYDIVFDRAGHAISLGDDRRVVRWSSPQGDVLHAGVVNTSDIAISHDGRRLAIVGASPQYIVDLETRAKTEIATGAERWQYAAYSPDGRLFVSGTKNLARIVDPAGTRASVELALPRSAISDAEWSPDGTLLATAGSSGLAGLWRATDGAFAWGHDVVRGPTSVEVGAVELVGDDTGLVSVRGHMQPDVFQFRLHGPIARLALVGDRVEATSITGDRQSVDVSRLRLSECALVRAVRDNVPVEIIAGTVVIARANSRCR